MDTNKILENRAVEWQGRAEEAESAAERADERADALDRGQSGMGARVRKEADGHREKAIRHYERAAAALGGRLLIHPDDHEFQLKNSDLRARCASEGRLKYPDGTQRTQ